jgi:hypothetical protein
MSSSSEQIQSIARIITFYVSIFILISGLIGNCFNIILFTTLRSLRNKPCGFYFLVESLVNLGQILVGLIAFIVERGFGIDMSINSVAWCKIKTTAIQSFHLIFLSTICLAAFDQFLSTHHRYSVRQMSTKKLAQNLVLCDIGLMIIHMILSLIFFDLRSQFLGCVIYNSIVANYYIFFFYPVLIGLLPITITITFSLFAFYHVRHLERRQIPMERRQFDRQLTAMTFARVIAFVIFAVPYMIFRIYSVNTPISIDDPERFATDLLIGTITGSLGYVNYVVRHFCYDFNCYRFSLLDKFLCILAFISTFSSSSETHFDKKMLA